MRKDYRHYLRGIGYKPIRNVNRTVKQAGDLVLERVDRPAYRVAA